MKFIIFFTNKHTSIYSIIFWGYRSNKLFLISHIIINCNYSEPLIESMWLFVKNRENKKFVFTQFVFCWWITNRWLISYFHLCGLPILIHHFCISNPIFIGFWLDLVTPVPWNNRFIHSHFDQWAIPNNSLFYWLCAKIVLSDSSERRWSLWQP